MAEYNFRPAVRENVGLFIGLAGGTGSGKTWSAMKMASGIVGPGNRFAVIDTENRRALHYADDFNFDVLELAAPFNAARYEEALLAAVKAGYKAIVVDSASHEHDGAGGYLDMQAEDLAERVERMRKKAKEKGWSFNEWDAIDKATPLSWTKPKRERKRMMQTALACSTSIPIIWCFRAEEKVFASKDGKLVAQNPPIWAPICGNKMPFEMTVFFMMHRDNPGMPIPIKLQGQHKALFPLDKPISEASGRAIAVWAAGAAAQQQASMTAATRTTDQSPSAAGSPALAGDAPGATAAEGDPTYISTDQAIHLEDRCRDHKIPIERLCAAAKVKAIRTILAQDYDRATRWIDRRIEEMQGQGTQQ